MKKMILESVKDTEDIHSLLTMIQEENTLAFNMFYEMYYDQVFRYTYYFLKDTESCREVVADVFFAVWQSRKRLKDIENLEAYLFISVRNEVTRYNKKMAGKTVSHWMNYLSNWKSQKKNLLTIRSLIKKWSSYWERLLANCRKNAV